MTYEDLQKLKAINAGKVPEPDIAIPQMSPEAAADPYNRAAQDYNTKAAGLEQQAAQPAPEPQGTKQNLVVALRNAIENMGRWGAPGGYYGQEELRTQEQDKQNAAKLAQAKQLRDLSEKQQGLGINAENVARQENYNQGQLAETARLRQRQDDQQQETARHNAEMEQIQSDAPLKLTPGEGAYDRHTGKQIASAPAKPQQLRHTILLNSQTQKPEVWSIDENSQPIAKVGDAPAGTGGGAGMLSVQQTTDANGNAVYSIVNKNTATATPVTQKNGGAALPTSDLGKANAKDDAKAAADYQTGVNSLTAMAGLMQKGTYAADQALADQFFNVIKPGSGARMNENQINRFITPGPLRDKMLAWAQKLDQGQPLTPDARKDLFESARIVVSSKKPKPRTATPAAAGNGQWSVQVVQ